MASDAQQALQIHLAITPKTARLLLQLGYTDYRDLRSATPQRLVEQLGELPELTPKQAESYRRAARRMVWLASQDEPAEKAKMYPDWTQKGLQAQGVWRDDYDQLTSYEANKLR